MELFSKWINLRKLEFKDDLKVRKLLHHLISYYKQQRYGGNRI